MSKFALTLFFLIALAASSRTRAAEDGVKHYLYSIAKSQQDELYVFDIDDGHKLVRKIPIPHSGYSRGICASALTKRLYHAYWTDHGEGSHPKRMMFCMDLTTDKILWEHSYGEDGNSELDRIDVTPDGKTVYGPSGEGMPAKYWRVIDAATGDELSKIETGVRGSHNTITSLDSARVYMCSVRNQLMQIADTKTQQIIQSVGPFSGAVRPFTINSDETRAYCSVNGFHGFEIGDIRSGKMIERVPIVRPAGMIPDDPKPQYHNATHGIALSADDREVWVVDQPIHAVHVFDVTTTPAKQVATIKLTPEWPTPSWITASIDGRYFYPSSGDVIERSSRKIVANLHQHQAECMLEVDFKNGEVIAVGKQFGVGRPEFSGKKITPFSNNGGDYDAQKEMQLVTKLMGAAGGGKAADIQQAIKEGASPNATEPSGRNALTVAAVKDNAAAIEALIDAGAEVDRDQESATALKYAAKGGKLEAAKMLLDKGAQIDRAGVQVSYRGWSGATPLQVAAMNGQIAIMNLLLERRADIDKTNQNQDTALIMAADAGKPEAVKLLLEKNAKKELKNLQNKTALDLAREKIAIIDNPPPVGPGQTPRVDAKEKPNFEAVIELLTK